MTLLYITICIIPMHWCTPNIQNEVVFQSERECSDFVDRLLKADAGRDLAITARCETGV